MKQLEFELERKCRLYARQHGWLAWKNEKNGNKGIPDDSLLHPDRGVFLFVEFKKGEKENLRPEQKVWQKRCGNYFHRIDNFEQFKQLLSESHSIIIP